jgi:signal transduction histidine kinase
VPYHALIPITAAVANLLICALVLRRGSREPLHRAFAGLTLVGASWDLGIFSLNYFPDAASAELWNRIFRTGICLGPFALLNFAIVLSQSKGRLWRRLLSGSLVAGVILGIANVSGLLVRGVSPHTWGWYIEPRPAYAALMVLLGASLLVWGERIIRTYWSTTSPRQRMQAKFWVLGVVVQLPFVLTNVLPIYGIRIYPLGSLGNAFFVAVMGYAIVRHRLMDVDYVVRKGVSFLLALVVVLLPGSLGLAAFGRMIGSEAPTLWTCAAISLAVIAVILVPTLQVALEMQVDRALFPQRFDYRRRLRQFAGSLIHILDQQDLVKRLGDALSDILNVETCEVVVRDEQTRQLLVAYPTANDPGTFAPDVTRALEQLEGPTLTSELEADRSPLADLFRARSWEVGFPLRINDRLNGVVGLGRHKDLRIFSTEDLQLLAAVGAGASAALENISLSRQLRRSEVVLERANRLSSVGMLAAGIAHEIRNPLVAVKTFLDLLPQRLDDREFLTRFRDLSLGELRRVTDLIADLLTLGKSKTAERRAIEVGPTLEPVVRLMDSTARKRQAEVVARFEDGLPTVWADADQLKQITLNLLLNAIDVTPAGGRVLLEVRRVSAESVALEVRDDGAGIPPDQLENIFHPFFTTKETGTGLGLALVHQMVVEHGGEIVVDSEVGHGTTFRVTLPTAQIALAPTGT